jgi:hypothetical protein
MNKRLRVPQSGYGRFEEEKNTLLEFKPRPVAQSLVIKIMEMKLWFM